MYKLSEVANPCENQAFSSHTWTPNLTVQWLFSVIRTQKDNRTCPLLKERGEPS